MADLLRKVKSLYASTASTFGTGTSVTITPASVAGLPTDTEITLTFDRVDSTGAATPTKMERIIGTISGGNFVVRTSPATGRGADGTNDQAHTSPVVEYIPNAKDTNDLIDAILAQHTQAGTHNTTYVVTPTGTQTLTNKAISPRIVTTTDDATAVIDVTATDQYQLTAIANDTVFTVTGTAVDGQKLILRWKDAGTPKNLTFTGFTALGVTLPTATTANKWGMAGCIYNLAATTWHVVAVSVEA